jgi:hypothetical protein
LASFQNAPTEITRDLEGRIHDRAAVGRMALDHLARPFRIEQVAKALGRVFFLDEICVDAEGRNQYPRHYFKAFWVVVFLVEMLDHFFR